MCTGNLNRRQVLGLVPGLAVTVALGACNDKGTGPVAIRWGKEYCEYCGMIVDDPRFAGQIREKAGGKVYKFDDFGDGVLWLAKQSWADAPGVEFWVGDVEKGTWIDARTAWYLSGKKSPMAHNIGAVPDQRTGAMDFAEMKKLVVAQGANSRCETPTEGHS
ncbi:nitrous oxide reductase accessory protein NosL [Magnetospirillum aberrantis]|uniref:Protein NosL n=1 Tax=Magnetospirillum aberrantis SpK TaxID=908842 RepID=A0A7C9USK1_9PROT|nr:nitrous oxide reductase accessory protein NosL [Magnetospirillum aberrantis]NFV79347.1 hypothetical protein [Magnetospirillum aberrantis SpK]